MRDISTPIRKVFDHVVDAVFAIILLFIMLGIAIGALQLFVTTWQLLAFQGITGHYIDLIADVLTLYVLIELSRSLVEYFKAKKLRLTFIVDAAIVFIIREVLIGLFKHEIAAETLYALTALLLVLTLLRIASVVVYQRGRVLEVP
jgi:uncharacterized membrane protein (DUF373 family)